MNSLPEPLPGWPTSVDYQQAALPAVRRQLAPYQPAPLPVPMEDRRVVGYTQHGGLMIPVFEAHAEPVVYRSRDLTPRPVIDPLAQRLVGAGACAAGVGWGLSEVINAAAAGGAGLAFLALLLLAAQFRGGTTVTHNVTKNITNHTSWWGKSSMNQ
ncbi:hypothetical protein [Streptomyces sp. NPDC051173]|uniref:hypothetical protein n=1 Tax=Streptomyces sp. NPDC051173 TaxID=3155164 RepID=UPI00344E5337